MTDSRLPVVVYGAAGFTGALICRELERQQIPFAIAGRSREHLEQLASGLFSHPRVLVAPLDDAWAMRRAAAAGRVFLSCAGPFVRFGLPALEAAIAEGTHWLDTTGEHAFVVATREHGREAQSRGIALVNAVGFDIVPSDAAAVLASEGFEEVEEVRIAIASRGGVTRGTARSMLEIAAGGGLSWCQGRLEPEPLALAEWTVQLPAPFGLSRCVSLPLADLVAAPQSARAKNVHTFGRVPKWLAVLVRHGAPLLRPSLVRTLVGEAMTALPDGPTEAVRSRAAFAVVAEATSGSGERRAIWVSGGDPYGLTAASAVLCARLILAPSFSRSGALSPAEAFGARALLEGLASQGVRFGEGAPL